MNIQVVELIQEANNIISITGNGHGVKYPKSLKTIVARLIVEHELPTKELLKHIPISEFSARNWTKLLKQEQYFNKVVVSKKNLMNPKVKRNIDFEKLPRELSLINFNLKILIGMLALLIFELLAFRLF